MTNEIAPTNGGLKALINSDQIKAQIAKALPDHMTPDRFLRVATTALLKTPKLAECDQTSFMKAMLDCSSLGIEPDGRKAHLIPFNNKRLKIVECQLIVDWKGLIELAKRSGEVETWTANIVYANDKYSYENFVFTHEADPFGDRGEPIGAVSIVTTKTGAKDFELMTKDEIKAIQKRSRAGSSGPWVTDELEMWKKTAIRRHSKRLTLSADFASALEKDADKLPPIRDVTPPRKELSSSVDPFAGAAPQITEAAPSAEEPLTITQLMARDEVTEDQVLTTLADMGVIDPETTSLDSLAPEVISDVERDWRTIIEQLNK